MRMCEFGQNRWHLATLADQQNLDQSITLYPCFWLVFVMKFVCEMYDRWYAMGANMKVAPNSLGSLYVYKIVVYMEFNY